MNYKPLADELSELIDEYESRETTEQTKQKCNIGDFWFNPETNQLYVCHGKVSGKLIWSRVEGVERIE